MRGGRRLGGGGAAHRRQCGTGARGALRALGVRGGRRGGLPPDRVRGGFPGPDRGTPGGGPAAAGGPGTGGLGRRRLRGGGADRPGRPARRGPVPLATPPAVVRRRVAVAVRRAVEERGAATADPGRRVGRARERAGPCTAPRDPGHAGPGARGGRGRGRGDRPRRVRRPVRCTRRRSAGSARLPPPVGGRRARHPRRRGARQRLRLRRVRLPCRTRRRRRRPDGRPGRQPRQGTRRPAAAPSRTGLVRPVFPRLGPRTPTATGGGPAARASPRPHRLSRPRRPSPGSPSGVVSGDLVHGAALRRAAARRRPRPRPAAARAGRRPPAAGGTGGRPGDQTADGGPVPPGRGAGRAGLREGPVPVGPLHVRRSLLRLAEPAGPGPGMPAARPPGDTATPGRRPQERRVRDHRGPPQLRHQRRPGARRGAARSRPRRRMAAHRPDRDDAGGADARPPPGGQGPGGGRVAPDRRPAHPARAHRELRRETARPGEPHRRRRRHGEPARRAGRGTPPRRRRGRRRPRRVRP